jgi:enterochelin esterase-like enzyme
MVIENAPAQLETIAPRESGAIGTSVRSWRYQRTGKRDLRVDLLRGFAVFAMVVDHIGGHSWLYAATGGNRFFVSAAEAFVFISGVMVGMVYGGRAREFGVRGVLPKLLHRAWLLYVLAVWLAIATALIATVFALPGAAILARSPAHFVWNVVTLRQTFYLVDVMLLYCFLMLLSPLALYALLRGRWWLALLVSWSLWTAYQFFPSQLQLPWPIVGNSVFKLATWQILFFNGLLIGFYRDRLGRRIPARRSPRLSSDLLIIPLTALFAVMIWLHLTNASILSRLTSQDTAELLDDWFDKSALPPARLAAAAVVFTLAWLLVSRFWTPIYRATGWLLMPFGEAALYAYAAHVFLVPAVEVAVSQIAGTGRNGTYPLLHPAANTLIQAVAVGVLWALTRMRLMATVVAPLAQPPFRSWQARPQGRLLWRPSDALSILLIVGLASALLASPNAPDLTGPTRSSSFSTSSSGSSASGSTGPNPSSSSAAASASSESGGSPLSAQPVSTVTAPRKVAGPAKGSSSSSVAAASTTPTPTAPTDSQTSEPGTSQPQANGNPPHGQPEPASPSLFRAGFLDDGSFYSQALERDMPYGIYLPPGYDHTDQRYPVLYMLHGSGGHYSEWIGYGLAEIAEDMIEKGDLPPMIIVVPQGDISFWVNHQGTDNERWGDYVIDDLIPYIDATYRTLPNAQSRAIGGLSMGAFGALSLAFNHPGVFAAVGAHSPSLRTPDDSPEEIGDANAFAAVDPVELATTIDPATAPRILLDVGDEDEWAPRVNEFHNLLRERGIKHQFMTSPGRHDSDYWTDELPIYLRFYANSMATQ